MKHIILLSLLFALVVAESDPSYDHQTTTYYADHFKPVTVSNTISITPYFSPDHSVDTETKLVQSATATIDIAQPSWSSWINCTYNTTAGYGCPPAVQRNEETFPIFPALLNALHSGVKIRILTNNYNQACSPGLIDPLGFLTLAGADVRYYTTTTFIHTKYIAVDGEKASVSSVNFSYDSFMENREAGVVIEGANAAPIITFLDDVFTYDFDQALPWPTNTYSQSAMDVILDTSTLPVVIPPPLTFNNSYVSGLTTVTANMDVTIFTSPDYAQSTVFKGLTSAASNIEVFLYQITNDDFCDFLGNFTGTYKILVSNEILSFGDYELARACYDSLYKAYVTVRKTAANVYKYSHQKFWIIDDTTVFMSTGNWGTSDFPNGSDEFPPYGNSAWRDINRDFSISITNPTVVSIFKTVLEADYTRGYDYKP